MTDQIPAAPEGVTPDQWMRAMALLAAKQTLDTRDTRGLATAADRLTGFIKTGELPAW